ncbi:phosphatidylserine decarboxylase-domain-containing protein [Cunninghamella echinulata]|nr:phosphatidylserine decarboxylase-domain-containing protein [Cunninghamella echinulata]
MDILTHVAICSANDWTKVDRFLMGNFITEQYAQRKWFVKLVSKVGYGKYAPGENNANIIVHDRRTGQLIEERMSVYIRLGMRLVYKGMKTGIQSKTAKRILTNLTVRQGRKFDLPQSAREIPAFIKFHQLDLSEVLEPLDSFKTFNQFFYRKLVPGARPCESPENPGVVVSPADCRMMAFPTIDQATKIWIKGLDFSLAKLFDDVAYSLCFEGGSLAVFRLAPQDYHRFHVPVDGIITETKHLEGQYYTVNPMAIRTTLDVYGDNARSIVRMETEQFGKVAIVCIGAMMVGSIILTAEVGKPLKRADELGYFAFGGSTLVVTWEKGAIQFDPDLVENSSKSLETLVRVGERIATNS